MKLSDIVLLRQDRPPTVECKTIPASTDFLSLDEAEFTALPAELMATENGLSAPVNKELLAYLRKSCGSDQLLAILENAPVGVVAIDEDSRIFYANSAYSAILGIPKQRVIGRHMDEIEPKAAILEVLSHHTAVSNKIVWVSSVKRHVSVNIAPLSRGGAPCGAVSFFADVTETKQLAGELSIVKELATHFQKELESQRELPGCFADVIGRNPYFVKVLETASIVAKTEASILIQGEHGVGKEVLARAIHRASPRKSRPFITVNCAAVPDNLLESELFGYEDGAFTGAKRGGALGKFELANGGVLFLDEIGEMPLAMQAKLMRALQEKEIEKIGRSKTISVDVRIVAATNRDLEAMIENGGFRPDLFYRLNVVPLSIPPLRNRPDDIELLAEGLLAKWNKKYEKSLKLSAPVKEAFLRHSWPGNVRELGNILEYAAIMCQGERLLPEHLPTRFFKGRTDDAPPPPRIISGNWKEAIEETERLLLRKALEESNDNRSKAIKNLGISRKTFYDKLKQYKMM